MTTRCKVGDIALIIQDELGCEINLGLLVRVTQRGEDSIPCKGPMWVIKPVKGNCMTFLDEASCQILTDHATGITHPDAWLMPIRPESDDQQTDIAEELVTEHEGELV